MITLDDHDDNSKAKYSLKGHEFVLTKDPVYGFWSVAPQKGSKTPEHLSGKYTALDEAKSAINEYVNSVGAKEVK